MLFIIMVLHEIQCCSTNGKVKLNPPPIPRGWRWYLKPTLFCPRKFNLGLVYKDGIFKKDTGRRTLCLCRTALWVTMWFRPLMENDGMSECMGITRPDPLFHPSEDGSAWHRVWFIHENRQTAHPRAYKCCLVACFTLPLISQIRLRLSTIQLSEPFIHKCMHICQQRPWPWVCTKKKIGRYWKSWLGRPSRSRGVKGGVTIVPVCHQSRPSLYQWGL